MQKSNALSQILWKKKAWTCSKLPFSCKLVFSFFSHKLHAIKIAFHALSNLTCCSKFALCCSCPLAVRKIFLVYIFEIVFVLLMRFIAMDVTDCQNIFHATIMYDDSRVVKSPKGTNRKSSPPLVSVTFS